MKEVTLYAASQLYVSGIWFFSPVVDQILVDKSVFKRCALFLATNPLHNSQKSSCKNQFTNQSLPATRLLDDLTAKCLPAMLLTTVSCCEDIYICSTHMHLMLYLSPEWQYMTVTCPEQYATCINHTMVLCLTVFRTWLFFN